MEHNLKTKEISRLCLGVAQSNSTINKLKYSFSIYYEYVVVVIVAWVDCGLRSRGAPRFA